MNDEDQIGPEDKLLRDWFMQSAVKPKAELKENIIKQIQIRREVFEYKPVIGRNMWFLISGVFLSTLVYSFMYMNRLTLSSLFDFQELHFFDSLGRQIQHYLYSVQFRLPEIPFTLTAALGALIVVGVYFIVSYKKRFFHT